MHIVSIKLTFYIEFLKLWPWLTLVLLKPHSSDSLPFGPIQENYDSEESVTDHFGLTRDKRTGMIDSKYVDDAVLLEQKKPLEKGYTIIRRRLDWKAAHQFCETHEGHLASFIDKKDAEDIADAIFKISHFSEAYDWGKEKNEFGLDRRYWIGLTDLLKEGTWSWVGKGADLTYTTMWYPGQPDHINPDGTYRNGRHQHCVSFWNPAYWRVDADDLPIERHSFDDVECDRKFYFICERDEEKLKKVAMAKEGSEREPGPSEPKEPEDIHITLETVNDKFGKPLQIPKPGNGGTGDQDIVDEGVVAMAKEKSATVRPSSESDEQKLSETKTKPKFNKPLTKSSSCGASNKDLKKKC